MIATIAKKKIIIWKPLSSDRRDHSDHSDRSDNDRWDRTFSISAIIVAAIAGRVVSI